MFKSDTISTWPFLATRQLWNHLPGKYEFRRYRHHEMVINKKTCNDADLVLPSYGESEIISRPSTDPVYQSELLQKSRFIHLTKTKQMAIQREAHVFRFQNGEWSYWKVDGNLVVTEKIADLKFGEENIPPITELRAVQLPWEDEKGLNKRLRLQFYINKDYDYWEMHHRMLPRDGKETLQVTKYHMITEDKHKGWLAWLAEEFKGSGNPFM